MSNPPLNSATAPRTPWRRILAITAVIGLVEMAVMLLLGMARVRGLGLPFWLETLLDTAIITMGAVSLFWFAWIKRLYGQLSAEKDRLGTEQRLNATLKRALDAHALVSITDVAGKIIMANERFCVVSGFSEDELLGQDHRIVNSGYHDKAYFARMWQTIVQGLPWQGEIRNRRKDGSHYWVDTTILPFCDEGGNPCQYVAIRRDITDLKEAQMRAQHLGERLQWLLDASPSVIYALENPDNLTQCTFISGNAPSVVGFDSDSMLAERSFWLEHLHPADRPKAVGQMDRLMELGHLTLEYRFLAATGQYRWISDNARVIRDSQGGPQAIVGSWTDITEGKAIEQERLLLRMASDASADMILLTDAEQLIQYVNPAFCRFTGWDSAEVLGQTPGILASGMTSPAVYQAMQEILLRGEPWRGRLLNRRKKGAGPGEGQPGLPVWGKALPRRRKDDPIPTPDDRLAPLLYWADVSITPIYDEIGAKLGYVSIQRDVSEVVLQEERLALARLDTDARLAVVEILNQPGSLEDRFTRVLDRLFALPGLALQQRGGIFLRASQADNLEMFVMRGDFSDTSTRRGQHIPLDACLCGQVAVSGEVLVCDDCLCESCRHPLNDMASHGHYIVPLRSGEEILGVMILYTDPYPHCAPDRIEILTQLGEGMGFAVIREQAREMVERARDAAQDASRQKSEFLANMSHEIRTPMNGMLGMLELLRRSPLTAEQQEFADTAVYSAEALLGIINSILDFSKIEAGKLELDSADFNLRDLVEEVCALLASPAFAKGVELNCFVEPQLPAQLRGDPTRLRQVVTNLVGNAIKFTHQGEVSVEVVCLSQDAQRAVLRFSVKDTGIGIAPENFERLFNPFEQADGATTRRFGGTGLGLSIAKSLINRMGGDIHVESLPGAGSTFWFTVDLEKQGGPGMSEPSKNLEHRKVLVVDDNATSRLILRRFLGDWGVKVGMAEHAGQALDMLRDAVRQGQAFDLVILDMNMPGMDGLMLARAIAADEGLAKTPRILLSSSGPVGKAERAEAGISQSLTKPVRQSVLFDAVVAAIEEGGVKQPANRRRPQGEMPWLAGRSVLLVEDNMVNQRVALKMLECFGMEVRVANNGREALAEQEHAPCDLVLMDCHMPEMDGYAATRALREDERAKGARRTPVIALTANALKGDREKCLQSGMDDHLVKPFMLDDLAKMLVRWLAPQSPEATQELPDGSLWDAEAALRRLGGDHDLLARMKPVFVSEASKHLARLKAWDAAQPVATVAEAAHVLKGMAMHFCAQGLVDLAAQVERKARADDLGPAEVSRLISAVERLIEALAADLVA